MLAFDISNPKASMDSQLNLLKRKHRQFKEIYLKMQKLLKKQQSQNRKLSHSNKDLMEVEMVF